MKLRLIGGALWIYAAWYAWSMYAGLAGINPLIGPLVVMAALALASADRVRRTHRRRAEGRSAATAPVSAKLS